MFISEPTNRRSASVSSGSPVRFRSASPPASVPPLPAPVCNQPPTQELVGPSTSTDPELDAEILSLLGDAPKIDIKFGKAVHKDLALRWQEILDKGLPKEAKDKILVEYLVPENCHLLVAPTLNPEVKAALAETMVKRDSTLMNKQKQLGIAIAALTQAVELTIGKESYTKILKPISDACRLLCDSHCGETKTRRGFVVSAINTDLRDTVIETKRDTFLFGDGIAEKLKSAKSIKKSATDLKQIRNDKFNKNNFIKNNKNEKRLNWKALPRKMTAKPDAGKPRPAQRPFTKRNYQQREVAERAPAAPATRSNRRY